MIYLHKHLFLAGLLVVCVLSGCANRKELRGVPTQETYTFAERDSQEQTDYPRFSDYLRFLEKDVYQPANQPVAEVGHHMITIEDMRRHLADRYRELSEIVTDRAKLNDRMTEHWDQVLERIIDDRLLLIMAEEQEVEVDEKRITRQIDEYIRKTGFSSLETYVEYLQKNDLSLAQHREQIRNSLMLESISRVVQKSVALSITPRDVGAYYEKHEEMFIKPEEVRVAMFAVPVSAGREKAEEILAEVRRPGMDFGLWAEEYGELNGGDKGWMGKGALDEKIEKIVFDLETGKISEILETATKFYIVKLIDRRGGGSISGEEAQSKIRAKLIDERYMIEIRKLLKNLRKRTHVRIYQILTK